MKQQKRGLIRIFRESAQIKTLFILFLTMMTACLSTYLVIFFSMHGQVYQLSTSLLQKRASYILTLHAHSDLSLEELVAGYQEGVGRMELYESFEELPPMRGVILESDMRDGVVYFSAQRDFPFGVIRVDQKYLIIPPFIYDWETSTIKNLVIHTLFLCSLIASVCTVFTIRRTFRPLKQLDAAISRVGQGDFSVQVPVKSNDEMGKITRSFNWMTRELGRIEWLRQDFVSSVSHEFKTPLAAVQGSARLLASIPREKLTDQKLKKYTGLILEETARMSKLSSNLLRLTKLEHQTMAENVTRFSLDEQIRRAILQLENQWQEKKLVMNIQLDKVDCQGDEELLAQVWTNLISNAIKFNHDGGTVEVRLSASEKMACVEIGDSGCGMTEEAKERIYEKFYQGDASRTTEGNGLGMSIVKRIIDLHYGGIQYKSGVGRGTLCKVQIPLWLQ